MRVLITGVAGLLGSRLAEWLSQRGADVYGMDDLSGGLETNVPSEIQFAVGSVTDRWWLDDVVRRVRPEVVYHFAAYAAEGLSPFIRGYNYVNNLVGTANVVTACIKHKVDRLVFTSSMAVYGHGVGSEPFDEDLTPQPIDPYGVAKLAAERDIQIAGEQHGLRWTILRPHNVYGRGQNIWDRYRNFLGIAMWQVLHDQPITIYGNGQQTRAFSDVRECLEPMELAGTAPDAENQIINLGSPHRYSIQTAAELVVAAAGRGSWTYLPRRHEVEHASCTTARSEQLLGYRPEIELADGIRDMWEWARQQPDRPRPHFAELELEEGLYPFWQKEGVS